MAYSVVFFIFFINFFFQEYYLKKNKNKKENTSKIAQNGNGHSDENNSIQKAKSN
jgi:hypothetical protein